MRDTTYEGFKSAIAYHNGYAINDRIRKQKVPARKPRPDEKPQSERFIETAREIGASEDPEEFEKVFKKIVIVPEPLRPKSDDTR